ncbi:hypothetical protein WJX84_005996 [Apatococcus fuscideae]|uniref:Uncharacterized protein n=1 Tax=Apatococcus fuscideae TaxID=2026836 RepID=A0AAW1T3P1_9CHLO
MWTDTPASITRSAGEAAAVRGLECARPEPTHATKLPAAMPAISQAALPIMMPSTSRASAGQLPAARPAVSTSLPTGTPVPSAQQVPAEENLKHVPPEAAPAGQLLLLPWIRFSSDHPVTLGLPLVSLASILWEQVSQSSGPSAQHPAQPGQQ